ncbi:MAG: TRAP transporter small permease [Paracoccaceae bacterium]|nr:TRAP transporter small permease [Paracoccaceae bacterium]MDG2258767.1 TRAP transporter small permease [Paracoccaceae bacterium]
MSEQKPPTFISQFDRVLTWISFIFGGVTLAFMTGYSTLNVLVMRKALNSPIIGAEDLLILSLVVIVALSIPLGGRTGSHIEIEVLETRMSAWFAKWSMIVAKIAGLIMLAIMTQQLIHAGQSAVRFGETTQQLLISYEPFYYLLAVSIGCYALILAMDIWQLVRGYKVVSLKVSGPLV